MKLHINESVNMTRKEAREYALNLMTKAVDTINSQLDCDGEIIARLSKDGPMKMCIGIGDASGQITPLGNYMLKLRLAKKIKQNFYVSVRETYGTVYYEGGYGTGTKTFGGGFNGTCEQFDDIESFSNFVINEAVPKLISDTNKAYKSYKTKYE